MFTTTPATELTPAHVHDTVARLIQPGGLFEVAERTVAGVAYRMYANAPATPLDILDIGRSHGDAAFLVHPDERWTYTDFFDAVDALATCLQRDYGVLPGDRVAIAMRNCPDWMVVFAAAIHIGAVVVPINSWGSQAELAYTLADCGAAALAADLPRARLAAKALADQGIPLFLSGAEGLVSAADPLTANRGGFAVIEDLRSDSTRAHTRVTPDPADIALLLYTSGSTGHPKGVKYRHVAVGQALMNMMFVGYTATELGEPASNPSGYAESPLITVPLFHATGMFSGFLLPCMLGQKVVLLRKWDPAAAMRLIQDERVTGLSTVPAVLKDLLTHPDIDTYDLSSIRRVAVAGAATPGDLPELLTSKLGVLSRSTGYGMTETAAVGTTMTGLIFDLNPRSAGIKSPIIDMRIAETDTEHPHFAGDGEIQMRGITVTPGYWTPSATTEAFTGDGWLKTGDLGHFDADGFLHVTGRIKEVIIRGGENISPIEIEDAAYRHPAVKEVVVVGVPDDRMGEELAMVCHLHSANSLTAEELRADLATNLPAFKVPRDIILSQEPLPRNASEKLHRLAVRRMLTGG